MAYPPDPCYAQLGFQDSNGKSLGTTTAVTLQPGQSATGRDATGRDRA
jgi:hypothetical protein